MATLNKVFRDYVDVDFSFARHPVTSNLAVKKNHNSIKQSILHLLTLRSGDKPFHPEIKSPIYDFLFENISAVEKIVLEDEIYKYLNTYEPRVSIYSIDISSPSPNNIGCEIQGEIVNTSSPFTVNLLVNRLR